MDITKLLYLEHFGLTECQAKVLAIENGDDKNFVILDQTCFYPQGGGQPYDKGVIERFDKLGASRPNERFIVEEVRFVDGVVKHIGHFAPSELVESRRGELVESKARNFKKGEEVQCRVDKPRRELNSRLHSAGHLVDMALSDLKPDWIPGKGYHFPDGPYVEYRGTLDLAENEKLKIAIEKRGNQLIREGRTTTIVFTDKKEMAKLCRFVPDNIPLNKPARVVIFGNFGVPCGGTHVSNLSKLKGITIRKIKTEVDSTRSPQGQNVRVGYDISR